MYLYHGAKEELLDGKLDLDKVNKRLNHVSSKDVAVFLTDDIERAITQYATPRGYVYTSKVSKTFANSIKQYDGEKRREYKATTIDQIDKLNQILEVKTTLNAIRDWWLKGKS